MRHLWPDSIAGRVILVLLVGLMISHLVSMMAYHADLTEQVGANTEAQLGERMVSVSQAIHHAPYGDRETTAHALSGPSVEAHWSKSSFVGHSTLPDPRLDAFHSLLHSSLPWGSTGAVQVAYAEEAFDALRAHSTRQDLLVSIQLPDQSWANFRTLASSEHAGSSLHVLVSTTLMAIGIVLVSIVCVRLLTAPLRSLAHAADRLGVDVDASPMAETGPREVRQAAHAFNEMQARLRKLITDRTQMLAAISHDLRTPVTRLRLRAEFVEDPEQRAKFLSDLDEMEAMVASALAFLRGDAEREESRLVDVTSLVATVCDEMADAGNRVSRNDSGPMPAWCRPLALKRAVGNLLSNAVKYGGQADVAVDSDGSWIVITIDDRGPGIPEQERERVFEPFYRLETSRSRESGGSGLGLSVARSIVNAHGGRVELVNRSEGGLRATVRLPKHGPPAAS